MPSKPELHPKDGRPILLFSSQSAWRTWLERNGANSTGVWLKFAKKGSGKKSIVYAEALEEALCFGWIDSQLATLDERFYLQRFTPRGPKSKWSKANCDKVQKLIATGRMLPAGQTHVDAAQTDGRWEQAYASPSKMAVPDDFAAALSKHRKAAAFFEKLSSANRYAILYRLHDAKKPETRKKRIAPR